MNEENNKVIKKPKLCSACGVPDNYHGNRCGWPNAYRPEDDSKYLKTYLESHNK